MPTWQQFFLSYATQYFCPLILFVLTEHLRSASLRMWGRHLSTHGIGSVIWGCLILEMNKLRTAQSRCCQFLAVKIWVYHRGETISQKVSQKFYQIFSRCREYRSDTFWYGARQMLFKNFAQMSRTRSFHVISLVVPGSKMRLFFRYSGVNAANAVNEPAKRR